MQPTDLEYTARAVAHLPVVRAVVERLGILDVVDEACPKHPLNRVSDAQCVLSMVYNILCGHPALYRMEEWLAKLDGEVLFGEGVETDAFNDTRLAEALDHLDEAGTDNILSGVVRAFLVDQPRKFSVHHDTTSVVLFGDYRVDPETTPMPAHGFSKDHRPDLKQLIFGLTLHGAAGIPLVATVHDGNTADATAARDHLGQLAKLLPDEHDVTFVGDCKLVNVDTLGRILDAGMHFVSLVPDNFNLRRELIEQAWSDHPDPAKWPILAEKTPRRKDDEPTAYRGVPYQRPFKVAVQHAEGEPASAERDMRFVVVHSDALVTRFDAALPGRLERAEKALQKALVRANKKGFDCEVDARSAGEKLVADMELHRAAVTAADTHEPVKRAGPGRPPKGTVAQQRTVWRIDYTLQRDEAKIAEARKRAACFVLITDRGNDWTDEQILAEYRHQYIVEGHTGFRWLKGPAAVAPVFLKTPERIRAMGLVLILALMVRNYVQATMRGELKRRKETLPHPFTKKQVANLTTEMAFEHFGGVQTVVIRIQSGSPQRMGVQLSPTAIRILGLFGFDASIYTPPSRLSRKSKRRASPTPEM